MTTETRPQWQWDALGEWRDTNAKIAQANHDAKLERMTEQRKKFRERLDALGVPVPEINWPVRFHDEDGNDTYPTTEIDGVRFVMVRRDRSYYGEAIYIVGECFDCGRDVLIDHGGGGIRTKVDLGGALARLTQADWPPHDCGMDEGDKNYSAPFAAIKAAEQREAEKPRGERLVEALEAIGNILEGRTIRVDVAR